MDRLTSGLVVIALNSETAGNITKKMTSGCVRKIYVARVYGKFPSNSDDINTIINNSNNSNNTIINTSNNNNTSNNTINTNSSISYLKNVKYIGVNDETSTSKDVIQVNRNIRCFSSKHGIFEVCDGTGNDMSISNNSSSINNNSNNNSTTNNSNSTNNNNNSTTTNKQPTDGDSVPRGLGRGKDARGKESITHFRCLQYDEASNTSLVECRPLTGRTHQIRLHLEYLGFPIGNDPNYGPLEMRKMTERDEQYQIQVPTVEAIESFKNRMMNFKEKIKKSKQVLTSEELLKYQQVRIVSNDNIDNNNTNTTNTNDNTTNTNTNNNNTNTINTNDNDEEKRKMCAQVDRLGKILAQYCPQCKLENSQNLLEHSEAESSNNNNTTNTNNNTNDNTNNNTNNNTTNTNNNNKKKKKNIVAGFKNTHHPLHYDCIWLHALRYTCYKTKEYKEDDIEWSFKVPLPDWALYTH